jgi:hypothetical protein
MGVLASLGSGGGEPAASRNLEISDSYGESLRFAPRPKYTLYYASPARLTLAGVGLGEGGDKNTGALAWLHQFKGWVDSTFLC